MWGTINIKAERARVWNSSPLPFTLWLLLSNLINIIHWTTFPFSGRPFLSLDPILLVHVTHTKPSIREYTRLVSIRECTGVGGGRGYKFPEGAGSYKYLRRDLSQFICSDHKRKGKMLQNMLCLVGLAVCLLALASTGKSPFCSKAHF